MCSHHISNVWKYPCIVSVGVFLFTWANLHFPGWLGGLPELIELHHLRLESAEAEVCAVCGVGWEGFVPPSDPVWGSRKGTAEWGTHSSNLYRKEVLCLRDNQKWVIKCSPPTQWHQRRWLLRSMAAVWITKS